MLALHPRGAGAFGAGAGEAPAFGMFMIFICSEALLCSSIFGW